MHNFSVHFVVVAAGEGQRFSSSLPKQFFLVNGKTIASHTLTALHEAWPDAIFTLVINPSHQAYWQDVYQSLNFQVNHVVEGGKERFHSVKNGLQYVSVGQIVAVHDIARPLVSKQLIQKGLEIARKKGSAIPMVPVNDALLHFENEHVSYVDRKKFFRVQTPQFFEASILLKAYQQNTHESFPDDASVVMAAGFELHFFEGEPHNIKLTYSDDLKLLEMFLGHK